MGWKNLSYWLKGGIIGLIISIILMGAFFIIFLISGFCAFAQIGGCGEIFNRMLAFLLIPFASIYQIIGIPSGKNLFIFPLLILSLILFVFGALIGWIVGKVKSNKKVVVKNKGVKKK